MSRYAHVIVDLSANALDKLFSYSIPEGLDIVPGQQVTVPFGPRRMDGFVVAVSEECALPPEKVKPLIGPVQDYPVVLPELMELADWMHERDLCNLVDALRLMIPAEMRGGRIHARTVRRARLMWSAEQIAEFERSNSRAGKQIELLKLLATGDQDTARLNSSALKALRDRGAVEIYESEVRRTPTALRGQ